MDKKFINTNIRLSSKKWLYESGFCAICGSCVTVEPCDDDAHDYMWYCTNPACSKSKKGPWTGWADDQIPPWVVEWRITP